MKMRAGKQLRRPLGSVLAIALAAACTAVPVAAGAPEHRVAAVTGGNYVPGEAIVRFEPGTSSAERRAARREADVEFDDALALPRTETVEVDGSVLASVEQLERQPGVAYAQPNYRYEALGVEPPNDPSFGQLWGLSDPALPSPGVSVLEAWEDREGVEEVKGTGQVIAVLDTGVDLAHPDLKGNLWTNPAPDPVAEDLHGYDFIDDDGDPDDYEFHGTHVAGTVAAIDENDEGIAGVAPGADIMSVRVLDGDGVGDTAGIAEGIIYAAENGADVINMSLGASSPGDPTTSSAVNVAAGEDAVVVAAAGNDGTNNDVSPHSPCVLPQANLICVAALNRDGELSSFSNYGVTTVDLAAPGGGDVPGGGILSTKTDYGAPLFIDDFESEFESTWNTVASPGGTPWSLDSLGANDFATDSLGGDYAPEAVSALFTQQEMDLTAQRGCRVHFKAKYEIEPFFDAFQAGAFSESPSVKFDLREFDGDSAGFPAGWVSEEASISGVDGRSDVQLAFRVESDVEVQRDGAYVDDVQVICRDDEYDANSYVRFNGTSMATPHVSGVVALVQAAAPGLSAAEVVDAVLTGASAIPNPSATRHIATEGIADACQAIAVATGADFKAECPGSSENVPFQPPVENPPPTPGPNPPPPPPPPPGDLDPPSTFFEQRPPKVARTATNRARVVFRFGSDENGATFVCSIDNRSYRSCGRRLVRRLGSGSHVLRVVARDPAGNVDRSPAVYRFRVERRR